MAESNPPKINQPDTSAPGYETRDVVVGRVVVIAGILGVLLILVICIMYQYFIATKEQLTENAVLMPESLPLRELRSHEDEILNSYKLIDAEKGTYQIPINRAMELYSDEAYRDRMKSEGEH